jgi:hypothetical protein
MIRIYGSFSAKDDKHCTKYDESVSTYMVCIEKLTVFVFLYFLRAWVAQ